MPLHPAFNALLNATSGILLLLGYRFIRRKQIAQHRACMIAACGCSVAFLISYVIYHAQVGSVRFQGQGWIRPVYFTILLTHTVLATVILPLAIVTLRRGLRMDVARHRAIARWTLPLWLYVSATGVVVYLMLYHLY